MEKKVLGQRRSKLGQILDDRNLTLKEFAAMVYEKTGYFIAVTNLSNYCTGFRPLTKIDTARYFAQTLELPVTDIL
jgi:hypothetical protein